MQAIKRLLKLPSRDPDSHKGDFGRVLVIAGSPGMTGAACLTAEAALRSGAGLVTLGIPQSLNFTVETKLTSVITHPLPETDDWSFSMAARDIILALSEKVDVIAIGPGLGRYEETDELVCVLLQTLEKPIILDADGINAIVGRHADVLRNAKSTVILTPHPGEMARLIGAPSAAEVQSNRAKVATEFAQKENCIVALKGHQTIVTDGELVYVNSTGNPGMATAGAGDVLTGMIAGLLPQFPVPFESTQLAVFLHGLAGDLAAYEQSQFCMIAEDIVSHMGKAFQMYRRTTKSVKQDYVEVEEFKSLGQEDARPAPEKPKAKAEVEKRGKNSTQPIVHIVAEPEGPMRPPQKGL